MVEEPGGSSTETAFCLLYIGLNLYMVLTVVAISMVLTGNVAKPRRYKQRKPMSVRDGLLGAEDDQDKGP